jgi:hypothetical protein
MKNGVALALAALAVGFSIGTAGAADLKVDLSKEQPGRSPAAFEPIVGTWVIAQDGADKVIMLDGRPWVASKDNPTKLLLQTARKLYGTSNEELMDNAKQFAYYPVAVLRGIDNFSNGTISMKFKTVAGESDRCSGILFNVKPNGDWLAVRYNDTENNVAIWEFHNGIRRNLKFSDRSKPFMLDRSAARTETHRRRCFDSSHARRHTGPRLHTRRRAGRRQERSPEPGPVPRKQSRSASAGDGQDRPVVEDRQHQLLQGLRRRFAVSARFSPAQISGRVQQRTRGWSSAVFP